MNIGRMHAMLAEISGSFSLDILAREDTSAKIRDALAHHGKLAQRYSPLRPTFVAWLVLAMTPCRDKSIPTVLAALIAAVRCKRPALSLKPVTDGALSHARERMGAGPLRSFFESLSEDVSPEPSFHGLRTWSLDGVEMTMPRRVTFPEGPDATRPDTPANDRAFGRPGASRGHSAWPQLKAVTLTDTTTHRVRDAALGGCREGERKLAEPLFAKLAEGQAPSEARPALTGVAEGDLALIDIGFYSALKLHDLRAQGTHFPARVPGRVTFRQGPDATRPAHVKPRLVRKLGEGDYLVEIKGRRPAAGGAYKPPHGPSSSTEPFTMTVRLIAYEVKGEPEPVRLVTDLVDPVEVTARELALLYHERWESEVSYDEVKVHLRTVKHVSSKRLDGAAPSSRFCGRAYRNRRSGRMRSRS
jgi:hypothetical protein